MGPVTQPPLMQTLVLPFTVECSLRVPTGLRTLHETWRVKPSLQKHGRDMENLLVDFSRFLNIKVAER